MKFNSEIFKRQSKCFRGMNNFLFALVWHLNTTSTQEICNCYATGTWFLGSPNTTFTDVQIKYFYTD